MKFILKISKSQLHLMVFVLSCVIGSVTAWHLGQDLNWDLLNYHFYNPWAFLHNRLAFDVQPAGIQSYLNPLLDIPNYLLRVHLRPMFAGVILGAIQGINIWLVFEIALILLKDFIHKYPLRFAIALGIGILSLFGSASVSEMGNGMGDNLISILLLAALLLLLVSFGESKIPRLSSGRLRTFAYVMAGLAVGLKLTSLVYAIPLLTAGLMVKGEFRQKIKESLWNGSMLVIGMLVSAGFWYLKMWQLFRNPIFPFYNAIFKSPYYPHINFIDGRWFPITVTKEIFYPFTFAQTQNVAAEPFFRDPRFAVLFVAIITFIGFLLIQKLVFKRQKLLKSVSRPEWAFWIFLLLSYVLWQKEFSYYRYIVPIELLTLTAIALLVYRLLKNVYVATAATIALLSLITYLTAPMNWGRIPWQPDNFGPNLRGQLSQVNGTVLFAYVNPLGFMVPYLPPNTRVISVISWTQNQQMLMMSDINHDESSHKTIYAIETTNTAYELKQFEAVGFTNNNCQPINTYLGQYQLCALVKFPNTTQH